MIKITKLIDIWQTTSIPECVTRNIEMELFQFCKKHLAEDISNFGMFYYIEDANELSPYFIFAEPDTIGFIKDHIAKKCYVKASYTICKDYKIYIFCNYEIIRIKISNHPDN